MKFRVRANVVSSALVSKSPLCVEFSPYLLQFEADGTGRVTALSIERRVEEYQHLLPTLTRSSDNQSSLTYPENPIHNDILQVLQYLESVGSFWCGIKQVAWERADFDWVPETDAERSELVVWDLRIDQKYPEHFAKLDGRLVQALLQRRPQHERLTVPLAFYREGRNEFEQFRYVQAFMSFYFMVEGLFGRGGPNYRVKEEFKAAPTLVRAAAAAATVIGADPRHLSGVRRLIGTDDRAVDADLVLDWLVDLRGRVHHYSLQDSRPQAHPHNQRVFESPAYLAMAVCLKLIPYLLGQPEIPEDVGKR